MGNWIDPWPHEKAFAFLDEFSGLAAKLGGPLTKDLSSLLQGRKLVELVNYQFDYTYDTTWRDFVLARQIHSLLQKQEWFDLGLEPRKRGEEKFWQMELRCRETNATIDSRQLTADTWKVVHTARRKIERILGGVPKYRDLTFSFGPGATTTVKGGRANAVAKLDSRLACSQDSLSVVGSLLAQAPFWAWCQAGLPPSGAWQVSKEEMASRLEEHLFQEGLISGPLPDYSSSVFLDISVHAGKLDFVPKDARSMRPIIVEPILNGFAQKGIGDYLKRRLKRCVGLDLKDQEPNKLAALKGSLDGSIATVDLSSASDTVSWSLVSLLLPDDWLEFLALHRTGDVQVGEEAVQLEKFSSMGNAYTFELESLIFFSLAHSVCSVLGCDSSVVRSFGDDIIVPTEAYSYLAATLQELGFLVNHEKSFSSGPFRESCGADWLNGKSVRPFYAKKAWSEQSLYTFHNFLMRNCEPELAKLCYQFTNPELRLHGPDGLGDGHLIGDFVPRTNRKVKRQYGPGSGGFIDTYTLSPKRLKNRHKHCAVLPSYSVYTRSSVRDYLDPEIVRGSSGYAKVSLYTHATTIFSGDSASPEAADVVGTE
jgi:hypothetical protein